MNNIKLLCQSAIRIENDKVFYFDPYRIEEELNDADYIFITHSHYDHYSKESIQKVRKDSTKIVIPKDLEEEVSSYFSKDNILVVEPNKDYKLENILFHTVPAYNIHKSFHKKENGWVGYIIPIKEETYYIAGDTDNVEELHKIKCDTAFVPIGGTYTMNVEEAVALIRTIRPKKVVPIHYQTIVGTVEDAYEFQEQLKGITEVEILMK